MSEPGTSGPADEPVVATPGPVAADATPAGVTSADAATDVPEEQPGTRRRGRVLGFRVHIPRTRRGLFALLLVIGAFAFAGIWTSVTLVHWTETADFCGRCHQMGPELIAYESGPHRDVTCGECHVEPGVQGWIKAKLNGTKQLIQVLTGIYPKPIPPPGGQGHVPEVPLARPPADGDAGHAHGLLRGRDEHPPVRRPHDPAGLR
jgi:hypothetical protein